MHPRLRRAALGVFVAAALIAAAQGSRADSYEPNDEPDQAAPLENGVEIASWISSETDRDWYRMDVWRAGSIAISLAGLAADYDLVLYYRNPTTGEVETRPDWRSDNSGTTDEAIQVESDRIGTFFVLVFGFGGAADSDQPYRLSASWPPGQVPSPPAVRVLSPNGGETWIPFAPESINYEVVPGDVPIDALRVDVEFSLDGGASWIPIGSSLPCTGSYVWGPLSFATTTAAVRVTVSDGVNRVSDVSDSNFTVVTASPVVTLMSPDGGVHLKSGWPEQVRYRAVDNDTPAVDLRIRFELSTDSGAHWEQLGWAGWPNEGTWSWLTHPFLNTTTARLRVVAFDGQNEGSDSSEADFSITSPPSIELVDPNGGERWAAGSTHRIEFRVRDDDTPVDDLRIDLHFSTDGGVAWLPIDERIPGSGRYDWIVPDTPTDQAKVKVTASDEFHSMTDKSGLGFKITGYSGTENALTVHDAGGANSLPVEIPINLANDNGVEGVAFDVVFDTTVLSYVSGHSAGRAESMPYTAETVEPGRVHVEMSTSHHEFLTPGEGVVGGMTFDVVGSFGATSPITLENVALEGSYGRVLAVEAHSATFTVIESPAPVLRLFVYRNPGNTRSLEVLVKSDQSLIETTGTAGEVGLSLTEVDGQDHLYRGVVLLPLGTTVTTVRVTGSNAWHTATASLTLEIAR